MATSAINNTIIGAAEREFQKAAGVGNQEMDKMAFLKLLVAQLQHQDPLNPMEDTEFVSQLAQFSSLESLNNISGGIEDLNGTMTRQESIGAVNYLGKTVQAFGDQISKLSDDKITELYYYLDQDIVGGAVNIYDSSGLLVRTMTLGPQTAGLYPLQWDGLDYAGRPVAKGVYDVYLSGVTKENTPALIASQVAGTVDGVFFEKGTQYLRLQDGRVVALGDVTALVQGNSAGTGGGTGDADSGGGTGGTP